MDFTDGAYDCNAGGVQNGKRVTLFHLHPVDAKRDMKNIRRYLTEDIAELRKEGPVRGFITGGRAFQDYDRYKYSKALFKNLQAILQDAGVEALSILWGRTNWDNNGATNIFCDATADTWYIHADTMRQSSVLTEPQLREVFKVVHIAPGDTLITKPSSLRDGSGSE